MALGREMHHALGAELGEEPVHGGAVDDVGLSETVVRQVRDGPQAFEITRIGELVDVEHIDAEFAGKMSDDGRADESRRRR